MKWTSYGETIQSGQFDIHHKNGTYQALAGGRHLKTSQRLVDCIRACENFGSKNTRKGK